jgi:hypothetical protein
MVDEILGSSKVCLEMNGVSVDFDFDTLPPETLEKLRRMALGRRVPLAQLVRDHLIQLAEQVTGAASSEKLPLAARPSSLSSRHG